MPCIVRICVKRKTLRSFDFKFQRRASVCLSPILIVAGGDLNVSAHCGWATAPLFAYDWHRCIIIINTSMLWIFSTKTWNVIRCPSMPPHAYLIRRFFRDHALQGLSLDESRALIRDLHEARQQLRHAKETQVSHPLSVVCWYASKSRISRLDCSLRFIDLSRRILKMSWISSRMELEDKSMLIPLNAERMHYATSWQHWSARSNGRSAQASPP
jgi:hypothetical protein